MKKEILMIKDMMSISGLDAKPSVLHNVSVIQKKQQTTSAMEEIGRASCRERV